MRHEPDWMEVAGKVHEVYERIGELAEMVDGTNVPVDGVRLLERQLSKLTFKFEGAAPKGSPAQVALLRARCNRRERLMGSWGESFNRYRCPDSDDRERNRGDA